MMAVKKGIKNLISKLIRRLLALILFILVVINIPAMFIFAVPLYCIRKLISYLGPFLTPNLDKILTTKSSVLMADDLTKNPKCAILACANVKGIVNVEVVREKIKSVIGIRTVKGQPKNIELSQYPSKWMGYYFWKNEYKFDVTNHINYHTFSREKDTIMQKKVTVEELRKFESSLVLKPFDPKRSPWEVFVVQNVESDNDEISSQLYLRFHHVIGDGYSLWKLFILDILGDEGRAKDIPSPDSFKFTLTQKLFFYFKLFTTSLYSLVQNMVDSLDFNDWKVPLSKVSDNVFYSLSNKIPVSDLNEIKHAHGVCLTAVIYTGFAAAMRKSMLKKSGKVPDYINAFVTLPMVGHPDKLRNHALIVPIPLPVGKADPVRRLKKMEKSIQRLKNSPSPVLAFYLGTLIGGVPAWVMKTFQKFFLSSTTAGSSLPGPKSLESFLDHEGTDVYFFVGPFPGNMSAMFTTVTYAGNLRFGLGVNSSVLSTQAEVDEIPRALEEEFNLLKNHVQV